MANVRHMVPGDVDAVLIMGQAVIAESPRYCDKGFDEAKLRQMFDNMLGREDHGFFVCEDGGGRLIGMALGFLVPYFFSAELYAADLVIYVAPENRGSSAALRLVKSFEDWAFGNGAREVVLGVSTGINTAQAVCVYEKLGYKMVAHSLTKQRES